MDEDHTCTTKTQYHIKDVLTYVKSVFLHKDTMTLCSQRQEFIHNDNMKCTCFFVYKQMQKQIIPKMSD